MMSCLCGPNPSAAAAVGFISEPDPLFSTFINIRKTEFPLIPCRVIYMPHARNIKRVFQIAVFGNINHKIVIWLTSFD